MKLEIRSAAALCATQAFLLGADVVAAQSVPHVPGIVTHDAAANELACAEVPFRQVGVCRLKGFSGFHRVYELLWSET